MIFMLCQNCGKRDATTHIKRIVNGETTESHLCSECANQLGYNDMFSGFNFNLGDFFGGFLGDGFGGSGALTAVKRCGKCGSSFNDIVKEGKLGCADCYRTFFDKLQPILQRIHGKVQYSGKSATPPKDKIKPKDEQSEKKAKIAALRSLIAEAVKKEDYEQAAKLRDEIKALESEVKGNE